VPFGFPDLCTGCRKGVRFLGVALASIPTSLLCDGCDAPLHEVRLSGVRVDVCLGCHGLWLDRGELELLARRPPTQLSERRALASVEATRGNRSCPRCQVQLRRLQTRGATVLRCDAHGVWLAASTMLAFTKAGQVPLAATAVGSAAAVAALSNGPLQREPGAFERTANAVSGGAELLDAADAASGLADAAGAVLDLLSSIDLPG